MTKIEGIGSFGRKRYRFLRWRVNRGLYRRMFKGKSRIPAREINLRGGFCVQFNLRHERTNKRADRQRNALRRKGSRTIRSKRMRGRFLRNSDKIDIFAY